MANVIPIANVNPIGNSKFQIPVTFEPLAIRP